MLVKIYKGGFLYETYNEVIRIEEDEKNQALKIIQKIYRHQIIKYISYVKFDRIEVKVV